MLRWSCWASGRAFSCPTPGSPATGEHRHAVWPVPRTRTRTVSWDDCRAGTLQSREHRHVLSARHGPHAQMTSSRTHGKGHKVEIRAPVDCAACQRGAVGLHDCIPSLLCAQGRCSSTPLTDWLTHMGERAWEGKSWLCPRHYVLPRHALSD